MKLGTRFFLLLCTATIVSACSGLKHLENGEKWLYKQRIEGIEQVNENEIQEFITLKPNVRIPLIGPLGAALYERGENALDTAKINVKKRSALQKIDKKIAEHQAEGKSTTKLEAKKRRKTDRFDNKLQGNFLMKTGTPLSVYDSVIVENSRARINADLINNKGFRNASVTVSKKEKGRTVNLTYVIDEGPRSYLDSLSLRTGDEAITKLLEANASASFLKKGDFFDRERIDNERDRIEILLRENGYFGFNKRFIEFQVFEAPNKTDLWLITIINKPADSDKHKPYRLDSIIVSTNGNEIVTNEVDYYNVRYRFGQFDYSPKVLDTRLIFNPKDIYNYTDAVNTQRQLINMDMFRYVNLNFDTTLVPGKFIANIYTAPLQKFQLTQELGFNVTEGPPGPFYNINFKNRNIFKGSEIFQLNGFVGVDGISSASDDSEPFRSLRYGTNVSLTFPRFLTPFKSRRLNKITFNPRSRLLLGFSFINRPEYVRENLNGTFSYSWQNLEGTKNYTFNLADISLIDTKIDSASGFGEQLQGLLLQGNTLAFSFNRSFVSSTSFNAAFNFDYGNPRTPSTFFRLFLETGGTIYDVIGRGLLENNGLENYQFYKVQMDYRRHVPFGPDKAVVFRVNAGIADPYSGNNALPYEKYFFSGGGSSNRAWNPRRLGPGSSFPYLLDENGENVIENGELVPNRTGADSYQFEQPGEVLLEMNAEYRAKISGIFDWAFFIDAGNIWRLRENETPDPGEVVRVSQGAQFRFDNFYNEIAIGAGLGLRLDFSFLVFRLDAGHKIKDPRFPSGKRWQPLFKRRNQTIYNISVGYGF